MKLLKSSHPYRILLASANPLFREGLQKAYIARWGRSAHVVGTPSTLAEALETLHSLKPDLVIVDHDDLAINRREFLIGFLASDVPMQIVLLSLNSTEPVVIYRRQTLTAAQFEIWLRDPWK